jgi:hypothetical protein
VPVPPGRTVSPLWILLARCHWAGFLRGLVGNVVRNRGLCICSPAPRSRDLQSLRGAHPRPGKPVSRRGESRGRLSSARGNGNE